ncbi:MAG: phosphoribosyltransferase family protein [Leadbetterella sp.]
MSKNCLLDSTTTDQKIKRIAFEIYEQNFNETEIIIAGIEGQGYLFAQEIIKYLKQISPQVIHEAKIKIDKSTDRQGEVQLESSVDTFQNKVVVISDDVLHTGKTVAFSLRPFLSIPLKRIQVAVLVNRGYLNYPIAADYVGYSLSTTLAEHVVVQLNNQNDRGVFLY